MTGTVDILLPYYGDVSQMKEAVGSVLGQTYRDWRLVVLDDGYPDPEPERWFGAIDDSRVSYTKNPENLGANGNYRKAVELAEAEWFVMMGADDVMCPGYLESALAATGRGVDIIQPRVNVIDENGNSVLPLADRIKRLLMPRVGKGQWAVLSGEKLAASLLRADWAYFPSLMWRTEIVKEIGFRQGFDVVQDLALILDIVAQGGGMALTSHTVFNYRRHSQSDSSIKAVDGRRFDEERRFFRGEAERFSHMGWSRASRAARFHVTSRLNAASLLPRAVKVGGAPKALARHIIS